VAIKSEMVINHIDYQGIIENALNFTGGKIGNLGQHEVISNLRKADAMTLGYFRYGIAKSLLENLQKIDPQLARGHLLGEHDYLEEIKHSPINIVIQVTRKTAAIKSLLNGVENELLAAYKKMMGNIVGEQESFVYIEIIDEDDLRNRFSYIHSTFAPPLRIELSQK